MMEVRGVDLPIEPASPGRYPADMESRVAVLEQIARITTAALERIERRMDLQTAEIRALAAEHRSDFRWLLGVMLAGFATMLGAYGALLGAMAHGFHWL
jgi:GAF domain-containing protein